jgi:hypothetical protein
MLGCGNSTMSEQMYDEGKSRLNLASNSASCPFPGSTRYACKHAQTPGFTDIVNIDISEAVINAMRRRNSHRTRMCWKVSRPLINSHVCLNHALPCSYCPSMPYTTISSPQTQPCKHTLPHTGTCARTHTRTHAHSHTKHTHKDVLCHPAMAHVYACTCTSQVQGLMVSAR